ncbi:hypothetical protein LCGC14_1044890 [marine sediment metagenome]|uniref:Nucleotide exchange factor GrpE n=1 Tax=marine sediment metagenome TaxID=412755 RepID=A0A0F9MV26_9ZZZZ
MGDIKSMSFEDYNDRFFNRRGSGRHTLLSPQVSVSRDELRQLKAKVEKYEALNEAHKKVKTQNDRLLKELDDMKEDGRKFKELMKEKEKFLNSLLRVRADFENYKKISERENIKYKTYALEQILKKLINHYDDLERAFNLMKMLKNMEGIKDGFEIVVKNFEKLLADEGVKAMNSEGELFDPYKQEAILVEEGHEDLPDNTILEELDKGYFLKDKILRPAKVKISKNSKINE